MKKAFVAIAFLLVPLLVFAEEPWDVLRPLNSFAESVTDYTTWIVFALSAALMALAFLAYGKKKSQRMLFVFLAFGFFFLKWLLKVADIYLSPGNFLNWASGTLFELVIFACLFIALLKR